MGAQTGSPGGEADADADADAGGEARGEREAGAEVGESPPPLLRLVLVPPVVLSGTAPSTPCCGFSPMLMRGERIMVRGALFFQPSLESVCRASSSWSPQPVAIAAGTATAPNAEYRKDGLNQLIKPKIYCFVALKRSNLRGEL